MLSRPNAAREALVLTGPTAVGKSELAVRLAERVGGEIVSADSRQVYRHLDIGTSKPSAALRKRVPHHGLDLIEPDETYSAGRFARDAAGWIAEIRRRGAVPIVVGGTGFFIGALLRPLAPEPELELEGRARLRSRLSGYPVNRLKRWLERLDPRRAAQLSHEGGPQRLSRSLEVVLLSGRPHSWWHDQEPARVPLVGMVFGLALEREQLYRRIQVRFDAMLRSGLLSEVRGLLERYSSDAPGLRAVGYAELVGHLRGERTLEAAAELAVRNTRAFARRQLTWFRHQLPADTVWLDAKRPPAELVERIAASWEKNAVESGTG